MLIGETITLRPVRLSDFEDLREIELDLDNRGEYWPRTIISEAARRREFEQTGFWSDDLGVLLIEDESRTGIGLINYSKTVPYYDELEIGYRLFGEHLWNQGTMTEALGLLTRYLFETRNINRIRLGIDPDNAASRRVAEKCGYKHEGTQRGAMFNRGGYRDMELYAITRADMPGQ